MKDDNEMSINLTPDVAIGTYANLAVITHSSSEFVLDFASMLPGMPKPEVNSRIIMTPEHAKRLFYALRDNLEKYEAQFGNIELDRERNPEQQLKPNEVTFPMGPIGGNGAKS